MKDGERSPGKVAIFSTCYVNYNEPGIGHDLLKLARAQRDPYVIVEKEICCGMPKLELGDLDGVAKHKEANIPVLAKYAKEGYAIVSAIPSCTLMFKQELPLMFPDDADVKAVQEAMFDPFEYLMARHKDGLLKTDFKTAARQGELPHPLPRPGAEDRQEDRGDAQADRPGRDGAAQHGRALLGPRRHLRREEAVPRDRR